MRKLILLLLITMCTPTFAQSLAQLKLDTKAMYQASFNLDFETVLSFSHPKIFAAVTREEMTQIFENTFYNESMTIRLVTEDPIFNFSKFQKIDKSSFCIIRYTKTIRMNFKNVISDVESTNITKAFVDSKQYKVVNFEKDSSSLLIYSNTLMIAVSDVNTHNYWKLTNYDQNRKDIATFILGETIISKLQF